MASASQVPTLSSSSNRNLYDVLRSISLNSLKRARTDEDSSQEVEVPENDDNDDDDAITMLMEPTVPSSSDTAAQDREDREDRFVKLASTVLYTDASCRKKIKRKRDTKKDDTSASTTNTTTTSAPIDSDKTAVKKEKKHVTNPLNIMDHHIESDLDRYEALLQAEDEQIQHLQATRKRIRQEQVDVWAIYKYGLTKIKNLSDLSKAPDAIMPGNLGGQSVNVTK